jgi:hypothetical protein
MLQTPGEPRPQAASNQGRCEDPAVSEGPSLDRIVARLPVTGVAGILVPVAVALVLTTAFASARLVRMDGNATGFVDAGEVFVVDRDAAPAGLRVWPGEGYDGQFYYRLALDPTDLRPVAHGIELDNRLRLNRIGYPAAAWAVSGGRAQAVPWALLALNVLGVGLLAGLGAVAARDAGRHPLWGLFMAGFGGFVIVVARDLTEITAAVLVLAGLLLARRRRFIPAAVALTGAVLTRESALVVVAGVALAWLLDVSRRQVDVHAAAVWAIPLVGAAAWQVVVDASVGSAPLTENSGHLTAPLFALVPNFFGWLSGEGRPGLAVPELFVLAYLVVLAGSSVRRTRAPLGERTAWALALLMVLSLSDKIYAGPADFRTWAEVYILGGLVLLADPRRRLVVPAACVAGTWIAACAFHLVVLH